MKWAYVSWSMLSSFCFGVGVRLLIIFPTLPEVIDSAAIMILSLSTLIYFFRKLLKEVTT